MNTEDNLKKDTKEIIYFCDRCIKKAERLVEIHKLNEEELTQKLKELETK